jgi:CubicO group peptidase (beta-lactamase class C family)
MIKLILVIAFLFINLDAYAVQSLKLSTEKIKAIDKLIVERMSIDNIPGVSVTLVENGKVIQNLTYGSVGPSAGPVTPATLFALASVSKSFTGIAILQMIEEGLINFDDPVVKHLPWFRTKDSHLSDTITIRQLLNHTSGFSSYDGNTLLADQARSPDALEKSVRRLKSIRLHAEPGTTFSYNNDNYRILGMIIQQLEKKPYEAAIQHRVFDTLDMKTARFFGMGQPNVATPHRYWFTSPVTHQIPLGSSNNPETGIYASALDMANYLISLTGGNEKIPNFWRQSLAEGPTLGSGNRYSIGLESHGTLEQPILMHGGWNAGFMARIGFDPTNRVGVVIMTNAGLGYIKGDLDMMTKGVLSLVIGSPKPTSKSYIEAKVVLGTLITLILLVLYWIIRFVTHIHSYQGERAHFNRRVLSWTILPSFPLLIGAWVSLVSIPASFETTITGIRLFHPDLGWLLVSFAAICTVWAICRPVALLITLRGQSKSSSNKP